VTGLDSSVVVRLLIGEPVAQAERARDFLDHLFTSGEQAVVSDLVVAEACFALQYHYQVPKKEALGALQQMFESGEVVGGGVASKILKTKNLATAKPGFVDRMIHQGYLKGDQDMASFEKKSGRLEGVQVL
jgi:predicted nucleic-acid-binding protein